MKKRNLKGMTLMEIVVSMAVYGVLALLMVEIMSCVNGTMRITNQLNKRLAYEAKFADNRRTEDGYGIMTATPRTLQIMYGSESIPSGAAEYTARYTNESGLEDRSAGTNYKYLVYAPPSTSTPTGTFTVRIKVDPSYPFPINSITSDVGPFTLDTTTGEYVNNTIPYPDISLLTGLVEINATVNCDMRSLTGGVSQPINDEHGTFIANSDDYPQEKVVIRYVTWILDSSGNQRNIKSAAIYNLDEHGRFTLVQGINQ